MLKRELLHRIRMHVGLKVRKFIACGKPTPPQFTLRRMFAAVAAISLIIAGTRFFAPAVGHGLLVAGLFVILDLCAYISFGWRGLYQAAIGQPRMAYIAFYLLAMALGVPLGAAGCYLSVNEYATETSWICVAFIMGGTVACVAGTTASILCHLPLISARRAANIRLWFTRVMLLAAVAGEVNAVGHSVSGIVHLTWVQESTAGVFSTLGPIRAYLYPIVIVTVYFVYSCGQRWFRSGPGLRRVLACLSICALLQVQTSAVAAVLTGLFERPQFVVHMLQQGYAGTAVREGWLIASWTMITLGAALLLAAMRRRDT